jgi:hypothetical protein
MFDLDLPAHKGLVHNLVVLVEVGKKMNYSTTNYSTTNYSTTNYSTKNYSTTNC